MMVSQAAVSSTPLPFLVPSHFLIIRVGAFDMKSRHPVSLELLREHVMRGRGQ
jgi:hypothetical protein